MENNIQKITSCIACGNSTKTLRFKKNGFCLYKCVQCAHLRADLSGFNSEEVYCKDYFSGADKGHGYVDYDHDKEPMRAVFEKYLDVINSSGTLLDIGAATGFFITIAKSKGFEVSGVEISDYAASVGRSRGLNITTGTLSEYLFAGTPLDVITMWDVLEHFPDPDKDIKLAHDFLKTGGILAINTPDSGSLYARVMSRNWHLLVPPEHIHYFNRKSLRLFLEKNGFEVVFITTIGKTFTLSYILHIVSSWTKIAFLKRLATKLDASDLFSSISIPINLFDNMFVIARKK